MLAALIRFALTQRLLAPGAHRAAYGAGIQSLLGLPIDAFPDVSTTPGQDHPESPRTTPEEVETRLAAPVEQEMLGIPHQRLLALGVEIRPHRYHHRFRGWHRHDWARQQVGERLASAMDNLPPG